MRHHLPVIDLPVVGVAVDAAQAIPDGHADRNEIRVVTSTDDAGRAVVEIHDSGRGIPDAYLERIFDPFFTTKPVGEGTGLGLSISYEIVKKHGGEIRAESPPAGGAVFTVRLPVARRT